MDTNKIQTYAKIIQDTLHRNTPISNEQFDYFLKINELPILKDTAKLSYRPKANTNLCNSQTWEILAHVKDGTTPNDLEETLLENNIIQNKEEIKELYYNPTKHKIDSGITGKIKKPELKMIVSFLDNN